ncbi:MAG: tRNA (N(6)-L-threonylcarbamoyladenosine(37)-C(2))-methylthiotransferase MtaB [bacterium]
MQKIAFYTLGCRSNQYETDIMKKACSAAGFEVVPFKEQADIYIINTCTVTGNADKKSRHAVRSAKKRNAQARIIATGCSIETGNFNLQEADIVLANKDKFNVAKYIGDGRHEMRDAKILTSLPVRANLMIENGCENFCSYCIVPFVRGKVVSKPFEQVMTEAKQMVKDGVKEIILTGINLGEYKFDLISLLDDLSKIDGLLRIRLSSIEPMYITDELIDVIKKNPKVCKHLHIPMQSGDDNILKAMNRNYTSKDFLQLINKIKRTVKDIAVTTDIIVGFPGEDEKAFRSTCKLVDKIQFSRIHIFPYSDRPGTAAFNFKDKIGPKTISARHEKLEELRDKYMLKFFRSFEKKPLEVLIEQRDRKSGMLEGLTSNYIRVFIEGLPRCRRGDDMSDESIGRLILAKFSTKGIQGENVIAFPILI